jgi:predicted RNA binding protein YcfA (HicA-like mRNA interferase family)
VLLTDLSSERIVNAFLRAGFKIIKQGKHIGMSDGVHRITIPPHKKINPYTLKAIIKDMDLTDDEFRKLI